MTNYVKATNFTSKDALSTGDPLKIIKGTEFDVEFNAIAVASATKADIVSPALTGTPTAPTATLGTNTTQLATTAFVLQQLYPVGSIYMNAGVSTNPATLFGFGTWVAFGAGKVMVGFDTGGDTLFDALEETGGSKDAVVVSHTHTATVTDPGHVHALTFYDRGDAFGGSPSMSNIPGTSSRNVNSNTTGITVANSTEGSSATNANLQPYITVAMWKRTA